MTRFEAQPRLVAPTRPHDHDRSMYSIGSLSKATKITYVEAGAKPGGNHFTLPCSTEDEDDEQVAVTQDGCRGVL